MEEIKFSGSLPDQTLDNKTNEDFYKNTYDYYISKGISMNPKDFVRECLNAADGIVDTSSMQYLINPITDDQGKKSDIQLPDSIRNFDFITPIKEKNLGEYIELPWTISMKVVNPDVTFIRDTKIKRELDKIAQQGFINFMNQQQQQEAQSNPAVNNVQLPPQQPTPDPEKWREEFIEDYVDNRAIQAKHLLNLIHEVNNFDVQRIKLYYWWWACEEFYTMRYPLNNTLKKETISPLEGFPIYNTNEFVEDYDAFVIIKNITFDQFLEDARVHELSDKDIALVKSFRVSDDGAIAAPPLLMYDTTIDDMPRLDATNTVDRILGNNFLIKKHTIIWPTFVNKKYRIFVNELGLTREELVEDSYELNLDEGDIEIKTESVPEVYVGFRYGLDRSGLYVPPVRFPIQRYDEDTKHVKLPVGGKRGILQDIKRNPIPKRLIPYMILDQIYAFQIERLMRKFKSAITAMPKSILNSDDAGTMTEKYAMMYADDLLIYDDSVVDPNTVAQGFRTLGMTDSAQYMMALTKLQQLNEGRANRVANMNDETMGIAQGSDAVSNVQQNIYRAKVGMILSSTMFNKALELDCQADLECAKNIYTEPFVISYFDKNGIEKTHDFDPISFYDTLLGIFVRNSRVEEAVLQEYRKMAQAMAQNGDAELADASISAESVAEIKKAIKDYSKAKKEYDQSIEQNKNDAVKYAADKASEDQQKVLDAEWNRAKLKDDGDTERAYIMAGANDNSSAEMNKEIKDNRKLDMAQQKQNHDAQFKDHMASNADKALALKASKQSQSK